MDGCDDERAIAFAQRLRRGVAAPITFTVKLGGTLAADDAERQGQADRAQRTANASQGLVDRHHAFAPLASHHAVIRRALAVDGDGVERVVHLTPRASSGRGTAAWS
jgi:hypothetical protein